MTPPSTCLFDAFRQSDDPRKARGVRPRSHSLLALRFLGLLRRQTAMASLQRWAKDHGKTLKAPLGCTRKRPPHATTIRRAAAKFSREPRRDAVARCVVSSAEPQAAVTVVVDGKTRKRGHDADGEPIPMLNICAHELGLCLAQFPVTGGKSTEPQTRKHGLKELLDHYPFIALFTGDARFTPRPLAQVLLGADRDFLLAVKDNQPALLEAILTRFGGVAAGEPDAKSVATKGMNSTPDGSGWSRAKKSTPSARRPGSRASR